MRAIAATLLIGLPSLLLAQPPHKAALDAIRSFALPGAEPTVAEMPRAAAAHTTVAAIAQLTTQSAAIMIAGEIRPGEYGVIARSKPFTLSREANFGGWIEEIRFNPPDRIALSLTSRNGCARVLTTHRFLLRNGTWLVAGVDVSAMRCTGTEVEQDWTESANYLSGKAVRTTFAPSKPPNAVQLLITRRAFPLSEFPPNGPEAVYADMQ